MTTKEFANIQLQYVGLSGSSEVAGPYSIGEMSVVTTNVLSKLPIFPRPHFRTSHHTVSTECTIQLSFVPRPI